MDGEIYHHGILGQKWGVRRFQNKDGSLTTAGKQRLKADGGSNKRRSGEMTDDELRSRISRLQMEETYSQLLARQKERNTSWGKKFAINTLKSLADKSSAKAIDMLVTHVSEKYGKKDDKKEVADISKWLDKDVKSIDPKVFSEVAKWYENANKITNGQKNLHIKPEKKKKEE